jgi:T4 RnlA family RNA ligase
MYSKIPTYDECVKIQESNALVFSKSTQVKEGKEITSFKYSVIPSQDVWNETTINLRGITFIDSKLVALPFPKFHNYMEFGDPANKMNINLNDMKYALEKLDGSLISIFLIGDALHCKSMKSVESEVAIGATEFMADRKDIQELSRSLLGKGLSPMFEYVSKKSRIVLDYGKTDMFFLGARDMTTGEVFPFDDFDFGDISVPKKYNNMDEVNEYLTESDIEGVVITMNDGLMLKMKTEEYVTLHKIITQYTPKTILKTIYEKTFDDIIPILRKNNLEDIIVISNEIKDVYMKEYASRVSIAEKYISEHKDLSRKEVAILLSKQNDTSLKSDVFAVLANRLDKIEYCVYKYLNTNREEIFQ